VKLKVMVPTPSQLTPRQRELLEEFDGRRSPPNSTPPSSPELPPSNPVDSAEKELEADEVKKGTSSSKVRLPSVSLPHCLEGF